MRLRLAAVAVLALVGTAIGGLAHLAAAPDHARPHATAAAHADPRAAAQQIPGPIPPPFHPGARISAPATSPIGATPPSGATPAPDADQVAIPSQHVVAPVDVCRIVDGGLEPPADVHRTCIWAGGAAVEAAAGTTVITGHINWVGQGTGALGHIDRLHAGDAVVTTGASGTVNRWRVVSVKHRPKTTGVDTAAFVGRAGARQLYLVTCGGAFDAAEASYVDNIYVLARPDPAV
jgi:hypothetical protein